MHDSLFATPKARRLGKGARLCAPTVQIHQIRWVTRLPSYPVTPLFFAFNLIIPLERRQLLNHWWRQLPALMAPKAPNTLESKDSN